MKKSCEHFKGIKEKISPKTEGCEECEKEGTHWVELRLWLACGHVGCCDSSVGMHATNHFKETVPPVMAALPDFSWKLCYLHESYS